MLVSNTELLLVAGIAASGCNTVATANTLTRIKNESQSIITRAAEEYDYDSFELNVDEGLHQLKVNLLKFNEDNNLLYDDYHTILKNAVNDDSITTDLFDTTDDSSSTSSLNNKNIQRKICMNNELSEGTDNEYYNKIPIYEYDHDNVTFHLNSSFENYKFFIGIWIEADACIALYDIVANWAMKKMIVGNTSCDNTSSIKSFLDMLSSAGITFASTFIESVKNFLATTWDDFIGLFSRDSPIMAHVLGAVIVIFAILAIIVFAEMIYHGSRQEGFVCGYEVNGRGWMYGAI